MGSIDNAEINFVESMADIEEFRRWLGNSRFSLAFDLETGGLESWKWPIRLAQFGDCDTAWVFRWDRWSGAVIETLQTYDKRLVGHNIGFDARFYEHHTGERFNWGIANDTMVQAHNLDPTRSKALKTLGNEFLSPQAKKLQGALNGAMKAQHWGWNDIPYDFPIYWGYAGTDCILTAALDEHQWPQIEAGNYQNVYNLEMQISRICSGMETRGIKIDLPYVERLYEETLSYCAQLEDWCKKNYNVRPSENQAVAQALLKEGCVLDKLTATGLVAMDEESLSGVDHPLASAVIEHRKKTKVASTYFLNLLTMHDNGVVHPSINTLGARTGRMSIQNPAVQTLPRGPVVRNAFLSRHGMGWVSVDYDAVEMRLLAHFCQDPGMLEAIKNGDIHTEMAKIAYNDDSIGKKDPRRQTFKNANFAKAYVAGVEKFSWTAGLSYEEGKAFLDMYDRIFPGVKAFQKRVETVATKRMVNDGRAWVKSPIGRIHFAEKNKIYTLINSLIQGTAADAFKQSLVDLDNAGFGEYLLLPVHDEANLDLPEEGRSEAIREVESVMTQHNWAVPLTVSAEGPFVRWGDKYAA